MDNGPAEQLIRFIRRVIHLLEAKQECGYKADLAHRFLE